MATRIGDLAQSQQQTASLLTLQARLRTAQAAAASGKAATRFAEIAGTAGRLVRLEDARGLKAAFLEQSERLGGRLQLMDQALGELVELAGQIRASLVQRLDGATGSAVPLSAEIDGALDEAERALNAHSDGRYLFAGSRTDSAPVRLPDPPPTTADPALYYRGDGVRLALRVDVGAELGYGITAGDAAVAGFLAALGQARAADAVDDRAGLEDALSALGSALAGIADLRAGLGTTAARLEAIAETHRDGLAWLDEAIAGITDADLPALLTRIATDQAGLEATYTLTGRLASLSLANYLR